MPTKIRGYILPENIDQYEPADMICVSFNIPNERRYREAVLGQILRLQEWTTWEHGQHGDTRATEAAQFFRDSVLPTLTVGQAPCGDCEDEEGDDAPYWDDAESAAGAGEGTKWGYENILDWGITAFLAVAAGAPGAAMFYKTTAPKVRLAFKSHDLGALVDIFIDGILAGSVDTGSSVPGVEEIIETPIDLVQFAIDHSLSGSERLIRLVKAA